VAYDGVTGPEYKADEIFSLSDMAPYGINKLYAEYAAYTRDIVLFLPRTSDLNELARIAKKHNQDPTKKVQVTHYCMRGASKALCVFFGDFEFT